MFGEPTTEWRPRVSLIKDDLYIRCLALKRAAEAEMDYTLRCIDGEKVFYVSGDRATMPGHIYSPLGAREMQISRCCEYHFDRMFEDMEEEHDDG